MEFPFAAQSFGDALGDRRFPPAKLPGINRLLHRGKYAVEPEGGIINPAGAGIQSSQNHRDRRALHARRSLDNDWHFWMESPLVFIVSACKQNNCKLVAAFWNHKTKFR
jgi:hypothetical protein